MTSRASLVVVATVTAALIASSTSGCRKDVAEQPASSRTPATMPSAPIPPHRHPVLYRRTGGIIGTDDRIVLWPDGRLHVTGRMLADAETRVRAGEAAAIYELLAGLDGLDDTRADVAVPIADAFVITIYYAGKVLSGSDVGSRAGDQRFLEVARRLEALAQAR